MKARMIICASWAIRSQVGAVSWFTTSILK